jgi:hypothetical protein
LAHLEKKDHFMFCGKYNDIIQKPTTERRSMPLEFDEWVCEKNIEKGLQKGEGK